MKHLITAITVACLFSVLTLTASADEKKAGLFTTALSGEITVGKEGNLELRFTPAKGYKWNKDYPAKITLPESKLVKFKKSVLKKAEGDIKADKAQGVAQMVGTGTTAGTETLAVEASFSV